ncbi:LPS export ABC transporter periplasmic protein LptC [Alteromonas sp. ASW11-130]|uniref:LPS export ABC transporter periplasmic protein LptC n=1 Tax=Alteromonas sp. ASW11-130 TaxID=3015775 RepID=UPI0022426E6E|nr:LPS export ABC transporter periplasmic protein LptC [Alteromonas sp. ASW11-130]MCW8090450.1 LPS export ABC transporter periplasmic protein LptC [Alteromonas sp. ASW11-130]
MSRLTLSILALFILAVLVYLPTWMSEKPHSRNYKEVNAHKPAYRAKNITTTLYDDNGNIHHRVFATTMEHYDLLGFVSFGQPQYSIYGEQNQTPWQLRAKEGTLYNGNVIQLEKDVVLTSSGSMEFVKSVITDFIELNLDTRQLVSDQPVTIHGVDYTIESNGLNANLRTKQYELIDHVQTTFAPKATAID